MEPSVEINGGQEHSVRHMVSIQGQGWSQAPFILTPQKPLAAHRDSPPALTSHFPGELSRFLSCVRLRLTIKKKKLGFKDELSPQIRQRSKEA